MTRARTNADQAHTESVESIPHIIPGVLYPAVAGKLLDGSTSHSGAYGTAQADGFSYYYTDIKGSKPIKDPRIGAHFGSQRYKTRSMQLLEQETAANGKEIFSIDGREWFRAYSTGGGWLMQNHEDGNFIQAFTDCAGCYLEITGYFNDINFLVNGHNNRCDDIDISVNGTLSVDGSTTLGGDSPTSFISPLGGSRFVDSSQLMHGGTTLSASLGTTPAINTVRYEAKTGSSEYIGFQGIELIAQDTTSTANKSKIQIPSQNVVSYGKKFTVSGTPHYDPFNGFTNSTSLHSAFVDTATSLGLDSAPGSSASWAISSTNNIRPYNGGRVVIWVDSSGTIKTSVNMMPPNAQNKGPTASNEITTPSATNTTTTPNMSDDAVDHSLSEVAKTFNWREFGNGAANTGGEGSFADASMVHTDGGVDDIAYVMDDGLTSLAGKDTRAHTTTHQLIPNTDGSYTFITFIGTGVTSIHSTNNSVSNTTEVAQNLPYGTHILKVARTADTDTTYVIDGITLADVVNGCSGTYDEVAIHQPKKPPIPEDCVVLADYMLMADFVKQTDAEHTQISKGVRYCNGSRDHHCTGAGAPASNVLVKSSDAQWGLTGGSSNASTTQSWELPFFGTTGLSLCEETTASHVVELGGSATTETALDNSAHARGDAISITETVTLGPTSLKTTLVAGSRHFFGHLVATPIHTSSHYQTFETPYLKELVGGDRNMEQTNLVVTPDGKTWDEVTRDTSYLGSLCVRASHNNHYTAESSVHINDEWRGFTDVTYACMNKDFAIAYDKVICLVEGEYQIYSHNVANNSGQRMSIIRVNSTSTALLETHVSATGLGNTGMNTTVTISIKRGEYVQIAGASGDYNEWTSFEIRRV